MTGLRVGIIGDFNPGFEPHRLTNSALEHTASSLNISVTAEWLATCETHEYNRYAAFICAPGSPYRSMTGALTGIRWAREQDIPLVGTCGGFQHMVIEYARHVMGFADAQHAEYDPYSSRLFITPLTCSLAGQHMRVHLDSGTKAASVYGSLTTDEAYYCNFGLNPVYEEALHAAGLRISGRDANGEARIVELPFLRYYVGTLFVPQARSRDGYPHPLLTGLLSACQDNSGKYKSR